MHQDKQSNPQPGYGLQALAAGVKNLLSNAFKVQGNHTGGVGCQWYTLAGIRWSKDHPILGGAWTVRRMRYRILVSDSQNATNSPSRLRQAMQDQPQNGGTGLGLAISRRTCQLALGGEIQNHSTPGREDVPLYLPQTMLVHII